MPVKSKSQWRKLASEVNKGRMSQRKFQEWTHGINYDKLPERKKKRTR